MLVLLSICMGILMLGCLTALTLLYDENSSSLFEWMGINLTAVTVGLVLGIVKTLIAACILNKGREDKCNRCCEGLWVVTQVARVHENLKKEE